MISAERARISARQMIQQVMAKVGDEDLAISAVGYTELLHGLYRATLPAHRQRRQAFLTIIREELPIMPYTQQTAEWGASLGVQASTAGQSVPYADLLIGATAMSVGYSVLTANLRHFRMIPGLHVIPL